MVVVSRPVSLTCQPRRDYLTRHSIKCAYQSPPPTRALAAECRPFAAAPQNVEKGVGSRFFPIFGQPTTTTTIIIQRVKVIATSIRLICWKDTGLDLPTVERQLPRIPRSGISSSQSTLRIYLLARPPCPHAQPPRPHPAQLVPSFDLNSNNSHS